MKAFLYSLLALLLTTQADFVRAQTSNALLWEITGNGQETPSYLFGTMHVLCPNQLEIGEVVKKALSSTNILVLELDMDEPSFVTTMQQYSVNPEMENISTKLKAEDLEVLNSFYSTNYGADMSQLGILRPITLLSMLMIKALPCDQPASIEQALIAAVKSEQKEIEGLETIADQMAVFDNVSVTEQLSWLVEYASDLDSLKTGLNALVDAYLSKDLNEILKQMNDYPEYEDLAENLLDDRNKKWISSFEIMIKREPTFFAVGAAHLPGESGLIQLLENEGFTLKPLK